MNKKITFIIIILLLCFINTNEKVKGETGYLNVNDYQIYGDDLVDDTIALQNLINIASNNEKGIYFPSGKYLISETLYLKPYVSFKGDPENLAILHGANTEYAVIIKEESNVNVSNIVLENLIFDNIIIHSNLYNHDQWIIRNNVFINGKKGDFNILPIRPDVNKMNGGELTAYYILRNNQSMLVQNNLFLRDKYSKGRGVGTYRNEGTIIEGNYFGMLERFDKTIKFTNRKIIENKEKLLAYQKNNMIIVNEDQGYFMTAINNLNYDKNVVVRNNIIHLNNEAEEVHYNDKSGDTLGYNRDHLLYAKGFNGLEIYGNYFYGQHNNADGGVKIRNGSNVSIVSNYFDDVPILTYIQTGTGVPFTFSQVLIENNIFDIKSNQGAWGTGISSRYYKVDILEDITIMNNMFLSNGLYLDKIKFDLDSQTDQIKNLHIENNRYLDDDRLININIIRSTTLPNININDDIISNNPYFPDNRDELLKIKIPNQENITDVEFSFQKGVLTTQADDVSVDGSTYSNNVLNGQHVIFLRKQDSIPRIVEGVLSSLSVSNKTYQLINLGIFADDLTIYKGMSEELNFSIVGGNREDVNVKANNSDIVRIDGNTITALSEGEAYLTLSTDYGYQTTINVSVVRPMISLSLDNNIFYVGETSPITITSKEDITKYTYRLSDERIAKIIDGQIYSLSSGKTDLLIYDENQQFVYSFPIRIKEEKTIKVAKLDNYYFVGDLIEVNFASVNTYYHISVSDHLKVEDNDSFRVIKSGTFWIKYSDNEDPDDYVILKSQGVIKPQKIFFVDGEIEMVVGEQLNLSYQIYPITSYNDIIILSSDDRVIKINKNEEIIALKEGIAVLTIKGSKTNLSDTMVINVKNIDSNNPIDNQDKSKNYNFLYYSISLIGISIFGIILYSRKKHL